MGHTALSARSMSTFVTELYPSTNSTKVPCKKNLWKAEREAHMTNTQWNMWPTLNKLVQIWGHTAMTAWSTLKFVTGLYSSTNSVQEICQKKNLKGWERSAWPTHQEANTHQKLVVQGVQILQHSQYRDLSGNCSAQLAVVRKIPEKKWPLEKLRRRRTWPTLNKINDQHSITWIKLGWFWKRYLN